MTTTSEKILSEMERMGRMKIKDLCAQMHWQYQKFRRRIKANDFSPEDLALIATSMNTLQPYIRPQTSVERLRGDQIITFTGVDGTEYEIEVRVKPKTKEQ